MSVHKPRGPVLPDGVEVVTLGSRGAVPAGIGRGLRRFIDEGQGARYLIGDAQTSPERPSNATYKLGVVRPRSTFTPHAHAGEHLVLSLGYASCDLFDSARNQVVRLALTPGRLVRIPALVPHAFGNRGRRPLLILAANTGYGIDHEDYAITAAAASHRAAAEPRLARLVEPLRALERDTTPARMTWREGLAARLRVLAESLESAPEAVTR